MEICYGIDDVEQVAKQIIENSKSKTLLFYGDMGVGKTTLIKTIVKILGCKDEVSSPTFSIVNEYDLNDGKIYHFDLYRINDIEETYNFGIEDYLDSDFWKLIEWPEIIEPLLIDKVSKIEIKLESNNQRYLSLKNTNQSTNQPSL
ncbi:tRNA (adenosine(37)-N6)-threonylcarbamoyltransferase complex ATPase subunit type 1 TsaE [Algibacter amylolyticus]|uniref:tRNA threonylcarbamoyladenosine biosynthesis protein TsaE n=1 Tax=Algibacter amylolyticus TaxID=1608400 RepID=A0A5M7BDR2_9FLAO|nr:tRNA (adenosine(37)-N6)-threonylcarbamoyltransferase complex ATPase subunit type 1 TsaE [Algibacter amylolyticus]KAA5825571.1 tRNA (adenosine(37)-N6)-threonylcarbamoyltransferase complex ATPase subunit type 1 TsaE [Algibacter amylolyticus]MBB5268205.1 tRNA threonylcarbamoyladenosine biosynthesis protein TsaE [Algibacter amylolyticus]TSJ79869.1 tRNA (adenosine(37)-N6)-threonylcarbamoyltransferase complex ATPase subunit type 1 TsaE [Algibacter amylolyticus]